MSLRMQARKLGLNVQLTSIDLPDKWDKSKNRQKTVAYALYRLKPLKTFTDVVWLLPYEVWKYHLVTTGWWSNETLNLSAEDQQILEEYGDCLTAIQITSDSVTFYWSERGNEEGLAAFSRLVLSLAEVRLSRL
ncbi:hypothetical protein [Marinomonas algarum]|nr:hypothetical protein [Marinomonas algarum]